MVITIDGKIFTESGILNFPDLYKQVLSVFKHIELESFQFDKKNAALTVKFKTAIPVNKYETELKKFEGYATLKLSPTTLTIQIKSDEKQVTSHETKVKDKVEVITPDPKESENKEDDKKESTEDAKLLVVDKKLRDIKAGKYVVDFDNKKFGWVLIYTKSGKRIPVKEPKTEVTLTELAKSISPINSNKK